MSKILTQVNINIFMKLLNLLRHFDTFPNPLVGPQEQYLHLKILKRKRSKFPLVPFTQEIIVNNQWLKYMKINIQTIANHFILTQTYDTHILVIKRKCKWRFVHLIIQFTIILGLLPKDERLYPNILLIRSLLKVNFCIFHIMNLAS